MAADHQNKHIRETLRYAERNGWRIEKAGPRAHCWGKMFCPHAGRDGCREVICRRRATHRTTRADCDGRLTPANIKENSTMTATIQTFEFTLYLAGVEVTTLDAGDALAAAGCDDGTFGSRGGKAFVEFDRDAATLDEAIASAIVDVRRAGFDVERITTDEADTVARFNAELVH